MNNQTETLLDWYDAHRRTLPWRALPGERTDPYKVWLSEIMLQQTTVKAVAPYFAGFTRRWPDVRALAAAPLDDVLKAWAGLGYYARARNLHACARHVVRHHGGAFPDSEEALRALPGIGAYTAAAIAAIAFGRPAVPVDGNVERVLARYHAIQDPLPGAKKQIAAKAQDLAHASRAGDVAQALMDLGASLCSPRTPACTLCPWQRGCAARHMGIEEDLPRKAAKAQRPVRYGAVFWAERADGAVLLRTRPAKGLLGAMSEFPGGEWLKDSPQACSDVSSAPIEARWRRVPGGVRHVFTHFALELAVYRAEVANGAHVLESAAPHRCFWVGKAQLNDEALPSVMRKVAGLALAAAGEAD